MINHNLRLILTANLYECTYVLIIATLSTHMREKLYDILGVGELIRCFLLQEGKPAIKRSTVLTSGPK